MSPSERFSKSSKVFTVPTMSTGKSLPGEVEASKSP